MHIDYVREVYENIVGSEASSNSPRVIEKEKIFVRNMLGDKDFLDFALNDLEGKNHYLAKTIKRYIYEEKDYNRVKNEDRMAIAIELLQKYSVKELCKRIYGTDVL